ncbi:elongation factor Tu [Corynebacterium sp.]|jgi:translation elongation factor EF-Tu-like GTPase|uniref:elongation factor Tu n=1 Tax=Corynebacterium sp. TaxID=1720 RepID=UPI0025BEDF86|nr:elongation factor Tu [Corynebacterium sp.]
MALFSGRPHRQAETVDPATPFVFRVDDVFTVTGRGRLFTGTVESGAVVVGAPAALEVGDRVLRGTVRRMETRRRGRPVMLSAGDSGAVGLEGVDVNDLPLRMHGGHTVVDSAALRGAVIRSVQPSAD